MVSHVHCQISVLFFTNVFVMFKAFLNILKEVNNKSLTGNMPFFKQRGC